ncbi:hypothetical protein [Ensifer sp. LC163]|uniref:hypothetical protein n=1 Tax=Ensifer sp. LC163 TaxID=1120652 RepID=UPI000813D354|nr:hypothetical protein [Ensifer sp. LC163]OCP37215.1 hypothetical protein BC360_05250 [Ensifer sp. LC163]
MTRPVSYACDPSQRHCECGHCALPPARNIDLDAVTDFNRAAYSTAMFLILLSAVLALVAIGTWNTEQAHREIVEARSV